MLHPTRLSLCRATPQAAEAPGMGKKCLEGWNGAHHDGIYAWGAGSTPAELGALVALASSHAGKPRDRSL
jgi:hypothetical protein